jgi:hypothetical protein
MKSIKRKNLEKVLKAWGSAYFRREKVEVRDMWLEARVMGHIRNFNPSYLSTSYFELYQRFLWRLTPIACVLAVALAVIIIRMDFISDYELAKMFVSDPKDLIVLAMNN